MGVAGTRDAVVTVDTKASKVILPITGGAAAATAAGAFVADTTAPIARRRAGRHGANDGPDRHERHVHAAEATDAGRGADGHLQPASGTKFVVGTTTVTCTATDANGNASRRRRST